MALKVGDKVPFFLAKDALGQLFKSDSVIGKKAVVVYFYPKDDTPQCTAQACGFRDNYSDFQNLDIDIIGISSDDVASHHEFAKKYNLPFVLLSDSDNKIRKLFGVSSKFFGLLPGRTTYLIDENGVIQMVFESMIGIKHVSKMIQQAKNK